MFRDNTTQLIIEKNFDAQATNASNEVVFGIKRVSVRRNKNHEGCNFYGLKDLKRTNSIEIIMRGGNEEVLVDLPNLMLDRIAKYMSEKEHISGLFDCASFAHAANGIPYEFSKLKNENWIREDFDRDTMRPGDTVAICDSSTDDNHQFVHFAIYVGDDLYLSKFGSSGPLIVANVDEMKAGFSGDFVRKMVPNYPNK